MTGQGTGTVRRVRPEDVRAVVGLIHGLADYQGMPEQCTVTVTQLEASLFRADAAVFGHVALEGPQVVGMALWYLTFSTWDGVHGIHLEDLYVEPQCRGRGWGQRLLATLARECVERGYTRLEWDVLADNAQAIGFYRSLGARPMQGWLGNRLSGYALEALAQVSDNGQDTL